MRLEMMLHAVHDRVNHYFLRKQNKWLKNMTTKPDIHT